MVVVAMEVVVGVVEAVMTRCGDDDSDNSDDGGMTMVWQWHEQQWWNGGGDIMIMVRMYFSKLKTKFIKSFFLSFNNKCKTILKLS